MATQSYTLKSVNDELAMEMKEMSENKEKVENVAERTGDLIGRGIKKGAKSVNDLGKGIKKGIKEEE